MNDTVEVTTTETHIKFDYKLHFCNQYIVHGVPGKLAELNREANKFIVGLRVHCVEKDKPVELYDFETEPVNVLEWPANFVKDFVDKSVRDACKLYLDKHCK